MTQTHVKMEGTVPGKGIPGKIANVLYVHVKRIGQEKHVNKVWQKCLFSRSLLKCVF